MFSQRLTFLFAFFALTVQLVVGGNPACLLGAINTEPDPTDYGTVCGQDASKVESQIQSLCGNNVGAAMTAFSSICAAAGKTVAPFSTTSTASGSQGTNTASGSNSAVTGVSLSSGVTLPTGLPFTPSTVSLVTQTAASATSTATTGVGSKVQLGSYAALLAGAAGVVMAM
ncbi:MAG: hypothetical protein MMC33_000909 [Icmadophila ericetorum]|nr:hypothetical protein [Icmadophila ericetorum]